MKLLFASALLALAVHQPTNAAILPADFDLISVVPRSPSVKPLLMPVVAREPSKQLASKGTRPAETGR